MTAPSSGDIFGIHRVIEPQGALPQPALRLDNDPARLFETEILVEVETLNIDAASFRQMEEASGGDLQGVARLVRETVDKRGKQHNPVTGSGGMLLGKVSRVGSLVKDRGFMPGDRIATLASLSLTPLFIEDIGEIRPASAQMDIRGKAMVFASAPLAKMPDDLPDTLALAVYDVAGAAPQVARLVKPDQVVAILGAGGKSGMICSAEARRRLGSSGKLIGIEAHAPFAAELRQTGICDVVIELDARDPLAVRRAVLDNAGREADTVFSCVNIPGVEMAAILATRARGTVYFFATTTSFTAAALGAEGVGRDIDMLIGNGYVEGHAEHTLELLRTAPALRDALTRRYCE